MLAAFRSSCSGSVEYPRDIAADKIHSSRQFADAEGHTLTHFETSQEK